MALCVNCGSELTGDDVFCPKCGTRNEIANDVVSEAAAEYAVPEMKHSLCRKGINALQELREDQKGDRRKQIPALQAGPGRRGQVLFRLQIFLALSHLCGCSLKRFIFLCPALCQSHGIGSAPARGSIDRTCRSPDSRRCKCQKNERFIKCVSGKSC